jgi:hypothetical protein
MRTRKTIANPQPKYRLSDMKLILTSQTRSLWRAAVMPLVALAAMLFASEANASHYRGAAASYTIAANGVVTVTA